MKPIAETVGPPAGKAQLLSRYLPALLLVSCLLPGIVLVFRPLAPIVLCLVSARFAVFAALTASRFRPLSRSRSRP